MSVRGGGRVDNNQPPSCLQLPQAPSPPTHLRAMPRQCRSSPYSRSRRPSSPSPASLTRRSAERSPEAPCRGDAEAGAGQGRGAPARSKPVSQPLCSCVAGSAEGPSGGIEDSVYTCGSEGVEYTHVRATHTAT